MKHFFTTTVKVILIAAVLITGVLAVVNSLTGITPGDILVQGILTPLRSGAQALTDQAERLYDYIFQYEALSAENDALKQELASLKDAVLDYAATQRENDRLRQLLKLQEAREDFTFVDAYIIGRSSVDWNSTLTINRGTSAGIQTGMCAVTENGEVVGLVVEAGSNYAVIKTVLDSSLEISATMATSGYSGMVRGAYSSSYPDLLRMNYLTSTAIIRNNDQVVTAGSTMYPRNLILGYVVDAGFDDTGVAKFAYLRPAANMDTLEQVFIITDFSTE